MSTEIQTKFPIVGIGASAGGLKAIEDLLRNLPSDTGMAFIIIQHLSKRYKSLMKEIISKDTSMPIFIAEDEMLVEQNCIYLIPSGHDLAIKDGRLELELQKPKDSPNFVVDKFFHSLGKDAQENAVGIILSGTGSDGSRGIKTIKDGGGIVIVQEPDSGEFDGMPLSAIETRTVDFVLPPKEISKQLVSLSRHGPGKFKQKLFPKEIENDENGLNLNRIEIRHILELIQKYHDVNFAMYKDNTIHRRIEKHMNLHKIDSMDRYYTFLLGNPMRVKEIFQELLIGVTEFFRDAGAFEAINKLILPQLITRERGNNKEIRIWVCACSTGEEVYSLAIAFHEYAKKHKLPLRYNILATDVNEAAIAIASKGHYPSAKVEKLSPELLESYFTFNGEEYEVKGFIRDNIIFARNDALVDPPFINLDLVSCRNLLIYLLPPLQRKLLLNFHFGLNQGGYLWLGASENILDFKQNFSVVSEKWKIFTAQGETPKARKMYAMQRVGRPVYQQNVGQQVSNQQGLPISQRPNPRPSYAKVLLEKFAPTCVLIDEDFHLLYLTGGAGKYLHLPDMDINQDLLTMVSEPTVVVLRDGLRRLLTEPGPLLYTGIDVSVNGSEHVCNIRLEKLRARMEHSTFLVEWVEIDPDKHVPQNITMIEATKSQADAYEIIRDLQGELNVARQEIQNSLEELETSNEELQSANEELLASNEELQSTNEELQSVNEELYTVNSELQTRNRELTEANSTIDNLLVSSRTGILFLDRNFTIRLFTPPLNQVLPLTENDKGNSIEKYFFNWDYPELFDDLKTVLDEGIPIEREVMGRERRNFYLVNVFPYYRNDIIDGVVINLLNITEKKKTEVELASLEKKQRKVLDALPMVVAILSIEGNISYLNRAEGDKTLNDLIGQHFTTLAFKEEGREIAIHSFKQCLKMGLPTSFETDSQTDEGNQIRIRTTIIPIKGSKGGIKEVVMVRFRMMNERIIEEHVYQRLALEDQLLDNSAVITSVKDHQFRYIYMNSGMTALLHKPQEYILGNNDFALFPEEIANQLRYNDEWVLKENKALNTIETYLVDEKKIKVSVIKTPITKEDGSIHIFQVGILQEMDIFDPEASFSKTRAKLEKLVDERTEALVHVNQELRIITRTMAHDLRGPLRAMYSFGQMLEKKHKDSLGATGMDYLTKILRQSDRMAQIIDGLMAYVKLGSIEVRKDWIEMKSLAKEVWEDIQYLRKDESDVLIVRSCPPLRGDIFLIKQTLTNLFSNALKYRAPKKACIVEFGAMKQGEKEELIYFVKDNGSGFDPKYAEKIFLVFERLHPKKNIKGHGVGLSIVKKSIELQGGSVWANSRLGEGATFYFSLPQETDKKIKI